MRAGMYVYRAEGWVNSLLEVAVQGRKLRLKVLQRVRRRVEGPGLR